MVNVKVRARISPWRCCVRHVNEEKYEILRLASRLRVGRGTWKPELDSVTRWREPRRVQSVLIAKERALFGADNWVLLAVAHSTINNVGIWL